MNILLYTAVFVYFLIYFYSYRYRIIFVCCVSHLWCTFKCWFINKACSHFVKLYWLCLQWRLCILNRYLCIWGVVIPVHFFLLLHPKMHDQICRHNCSGLCNMCILGIENILALLCCTEGPILYFT